MNPTKVDDDRIILTWDVDVDLDLHLVIFDADHSGYCEVFSNNLNCPGTSLDVDIQNGSGPEIITLKSELQVIMPKNPHYIGSLILVYRDKTMQTFQNTQ